MVKQRLQSLSAVQLIFSAYLIGALVCTVLLLLPVSRKPGAELTLMDAFFTATSAISVTGLTTVETAETFSLFGQGVLLCAFEFGGIGIMTLGTLLWMLLGRNVTLSQRRLLMIDQNQNQLAGLVRLLRIIVAMVVLVEAAGTLFFTLYFRLAGYVEGWGQAFYYALFHAVSSYTNAGFDVFGDSLAGFRQDYAVQSATMLLIVLGSVGFPVLVELWHYVTAGKDRPSFRFSLFAKLTLITYLSLFVAGAIGIWLFERQAAFAGMVWHEQLFHAMFNSVTVRSAGLTLSDLSGFGTDSHVLLSVLMFIGSSPSSAGGGIRTTTFAVLVLTFISVACMRGDVTAFRRTIKQEDVKKSFFVFVLGILLCAGAVLFISAMEGNRHSLEALLFETASAFGTCGASLGITADLSGAAQASLIVLMFTGRVGLLTLLGLFHKERQKPVNYRYPEEKIIIG